MPGLPHFIIHVCQSVVATEELFERTVSVGVTKSSLCKEEFILPYGSRGSVHNSQEGMVCSRGRYLAG